MKIRVSKNRIIDGLQKAGAIIPTKSGAAYLRSIWLRGEEGKLSIMTTDASMEFTGTYEAEVLEPGLVGVAGRTLVDLIRQFPPGEIEMSLDKEKNTLLIKQGSRNRYKLPVYSSEWFQAFAEFPAGEPVIWAGSEISEVIDQVAYSIDDEERDAMACLCFNPREKGIIDICGMNGHQFAMVRIANDNLCAHLPEKGLLINRKYIPDIKKWLPEDEIELNLSEKRLFLKDSKNNEMLSILRDSNYKYPDYNVFLSRLDDSGCSRMELPRQEMIDALKRLIVISVDEPKPSVFMTLSPTELSMRANSADGSAHESLNISYDGSITNITFPSKDLSEIFSHFRSDCLKMTFTGQEGPCGITWGGEEMAPEDKDYQVILMPMRVSEEVYYQEEND